MNPSATSEPTPDPEGIATPITSSAEIWHVAQLAALRRASEIVEKMLPDGQGAPVRDAIRGAATSSWHAFVALASSSQAQRNAYLEGGEPLHIALDDREGLPVVIWRENNPAFADAWGYQRIQPTGRPDVPVVQLSTPFKLVETDRLPAGTRTTMLRDPHHVAIAALVELVTMVAQDLERIIDTTDDAGMWSAMDSHRHFLAAGARMSIENLAFDEWRDCQPPEAGRYVALGEAPEHVATRGVTTRAKQALALRITANWYGDVQDDAERAGIADRIARANYVLERVHHNREWLEGLLDAYNVQAIERYNAEKVRTSAELTASDLVVPADTACRVIFRAIPHSKLPLLAFVPRAAAEPVALRYQPRGGRTTE